MGRANTLWNSSMSKAEKNKKESMPSTQNAFVGQKAAPTEGALALALEATLPLWKRLVADLKHDLKLDVAEWHSSSVKHGWSLRLQLKKRNIVYLGPRQGWFVAAFALGDRAVAVARQTSLPKEVVQNINTSKRYAEGTAVRIDIRESANVDTVKTLAKIKIEN